MAETVSVAAALNITVTEVLDSTINPGAPAANRTVIHSQFNTSKALTGASSQPTTKVSCKTQSLIAGALTLDLRALLGTNGASIDGNGLKMQFLKIRNKAGNAPMTFVTGASNGYLVAGAAWKFILAAGQEVIFDLNDASPDIDATHKTIDVTGTGTDAFEALIVLG